MRMLSEIVASLTPKKKAFVIGSAFVDMVINVLLVQRGGRPPQARSSL